MPNFLLSEGFGAYVSGVIGSGYHACFNCFHSDALPYKVESDIDVFGVRVVDGVFGKKEGSMVVNEEISGSGRS